MATRFACVHCGAPITTSAGVGAAVGCPSCRARVKVPAQPEDSDGYEVMSVEQARSQAPSPAAAAAPGISAQPTGDAGHIRFACPHCRSMIKAPRTVAGRKSKCPSCKEPVRVPETDAVALSSGKASDDDLIDIDMNTRGAGGRELEYRNDVAESVPAITDEPLEPAAHIRFACDSCGRTIKSPRNLAGRKSRCPQCGERVVIPQPSEILDGDVFVLDTKGRSTGALTYRESDAADVSPSGRDSGSGSAAGPSHVQFKCPHCGSGIKAPAAVAGRRSKCPSCHEKVTVPLLEAPKQQTDIEIGDVVVRRQEDNWAPESMSTAKATKGPIRFKCPDCGSQIKAPPQYQGKKSHCPACKARVVIPTVSLAAAVDEAQPIELLDMSEEDEDKLLEALSRQTRGSSISGIAVVAEQAAMASELTGGALARGPLNSDDEMEIQSKVKHNKPKPK